MVIFFKPEPSIVPQPDADVREAASTARHVMVIDDNESIVFSTELLLKSWGYVASSAPDGESGVKKALDERPDAVIVDLGLPGMSGLEVARRLRAEPGPHIFLVALTGYSQPSDRAKTEAVGFDAHLVKPVDPRLLRRVLSEALAQD